VAPWEVRERIPEVGVLAALALERWEAALVLNQEVASSKAARGAPPLELAETRFNDYGPLLGLGRLDEARARVLACRKVFEEEGNVAGLGKVFSALATLEAELGHPDDAIGLEQTGLRYTYVGLDPNDLVVSHFNLAAYLWRAGRDPAVALAHQLAAAVLAYQTGVQDQWLAALAHRLRQLGDTAPVPGSFQVLCDRVEQVKGVRFAELVARLSGPAASGDEVLAEVLRLAREILAQLEPVLAALVAAAQGNPQARAAIEPLLAELTGAGGAALAVVLRRILDGERGERLLAGLDEVSTQLVSEVLRRLQG
jgi:hypothetical protein